MSGIKKWGPQTWIFFHTFACKIDEKFFESNRDQCLTVIKNICGALPCPYCMKHAVSFMKNVNASNVATKAELNEMLFQFHNLVNKRLRKHVQDAEMLDIYRHSRIDIALVNFINGYSRKYGSLMAGTPSMQMRRRSVARGVQEWMGKHWRYFQN